MTDLGIQFFKLFLLDYLVRASFDARYNQLCCRRLTRSIGSKTRVPGAARSVDAAVKRETGACPPDIMPVLPPQR